MRLAIQIISVFYVLIALYLVLTHVTGVEGLTKIGFGGTNTILRTLQGR